MTSTTNNSAKPKLTSTLDLTDLQSQVKALTKKINDIIGNRNSIHQKISIPTINGFEMVTISDILKLESQDGYVMIQLVGQKEMITSKRFEYFTQKLDDKSFVRIHRSYIVNIDFITKYLKTGIIVLTNGEQFPVSKTYKKRVVEVLCG